MEKNEKNKKTFFSSSYTMNNKKVNWSPNFIGKGSFLVGIFLAIVLGLGFSGAYQKEVLWTVFLLGIVVGILNITVEEIYGFLAGGTVLVLLSFLGIQVGIFDMVAPVITNILKGILILFVPATMIVAIKTVFAYAQK